MTKKIINSGSNPDDWIEKLNKTITSEPGPTMKGLKELLKDGQETNVPQESLDTLRDYIDVVDNWCSDAEKLLSFKSESKSSSTKKRDQRVRDLIDQAALIGFDMPYIDQLKSYSEKLEKFTSKLTEQVLSSNDREMQMKLYQEGQQLRADSIKFNQLKNSLESCSWEEQVEKAIQQPFNPKVIRKLIKDAEDLGMTDADGPWLKRLIIMEETGRELIQRIENICKGKEKIDFDQESTILKMGENKQDPNLSIILDTHLINRLSNAMARSKNTINEIENMLNVQSIKPAVTDRPSLTEAQRLMSMCRELSFKTDLVPRLSNALTQMGTWNDQLRSTFMNGRQKSLETVIRESLSNVQRITTSEDKKGIWCICRRAEAGLMIECDICHEWYHSSCLKVPRNVVRSSSSYICPICHPTETTKKVTHLSRQPKLEEISDLLSSGELLKFRPKDYSIIVDIHAHMQEYRNRVQAFCRSRTQLGLEDMQKIKYYLRTLTGLEVALQDETEFLRSKIQALTPVSPASTQTSNSISAASLPSHKVATAAAAAKFAATNVENNSGLKQATLGKSDSSGNYSNASTPDRKLKTTVRPLSSNHQRLPSTNINCACQRTEETKKDLIQCIHCKNFSHVDCVGCYLDPPKDFKCGQCVESTETRKLLQYVYLISQTNFILDSPRLLLTNMRRDEITSSRPQKIIKLTVKPPALPIKKTSSHNKRRQYSPDEDKQHTKKHRSLKDDAPYRSHHRI